MNHPPPNTPINSSFRDPMGFVFQKAGVVYRHVNRAYQPHYEQLMQSGLYEILTTAGLLVSHESVPNPLPLRSDHTYAVLKPTQLHWISYPYEWSFSQLKDAALATLRIQQIALEHHMILKDASCFNMQYQHGQPILIDTLSFERYEPGHPWQAYRQFCQHFLAPLALMAHVDIRLNRLFSNFIDGIPLDLTNRLLPLRKKFNLSVLLHICLHSKYQSKNKSSPNKAILSKKGLLSIIDSLQSAIKKLRWSPKHTTWFDYYDHNHNYGNEGLTQKADLIESVANTIRPKTVWDLGANTGRFSRLFAKQGASVVSWDIDPACVELNYLQIRRNQEKNILPLVLDLTNPTSSYGWACRERLSFPERAPVDLILALGFIHHLAIGNNVPLPHIFSFFASLSQYALVEFVPKEDSNAQKLLANRPDIFDHYHQAAFENAAQTLFHITNRMPIPSTQRILYVLKRKNLEN